LLVTDYNKKMLLVALSQKCCCKSLIVHGFKLQCVIVSLSFNVSLYPWVISTCES